MDEFNLLVDMSIIGREQEGSRTAARAVVASFVRPGGGLCRHAGT